MVEYGNFLQKYNKVMLYFQIHVFWMGKILVYFRAIIKQLYDETGQGMDYVIFKIPFSPFL